MPGTLCVVIHDVAPATLQECLRLRDSVAEVGDFAVTLLAVPRYHCEPRSHAYEQWLCERAARGDEIALHGYTHLDDSPPRGWLDFLRRRVYTRGEGEFCDLTFDDAMLRLRAGRRWLRELGLAPRGFVAPAWLLGEAAWRAVERYDFSYTCTLRRIHLLPEGRSVVCQSQVYSSSSAPRRALSVAWNDGLARLQQSAPQVRLELHPPDVRHGAVHHAWRRIAARQARHRRVCTLGQLVDSLRKEPVPIRP